MPNFYFRAHWRFVPRASAAARRAALRVNAGQGRDGTAAVLQKIGKGRAERRRRTGAGKDVISDIPRPIPLQRDKMRPAAVKIPQNRHLVRFRKAVKILPPAARRDGAAAFAEKAARREGKRPEQPEQQRAAPLKPTDDLRRVNALSEKIRRIIRRNHAAAVIACTEETVAQPAARRGALVEEKSLRPDRAVFAQIDRAHGGTGKDYRRKS